MVKNNAKVEKSVRVLGRQLGRVLTSAEMDAIAGANGGNSTTLYLEDNDHSAF